MVYFIEKTPGAVTGGTPAFPLIRGKILDLTWNKISKQMVSILMVKYATKLLDTWLDQASWNTWKLFISKKDASILLTGHVNVLLGDLVWQKSSWDHSCYNALNMPDDSTQHQQSDAGACRCWVVLAILVAWEVKLCHSSTTTGTAVLYAVNSSTFLLQKNKFCKYFIAITDIKWKHTFDFFTFTPYPNLCIFI